MTQQLADTITPAPQHEPGTLQTSDRPLQFEVIPHVCSIADVCRLLLLSESQFFRLMARKRLALAELDLGDSKRRFTGESVARVIRMRKQ